MKLRWKEFERRVRRPLRARLRQSPADWKEYRRYGWWQKLTHREQQVVPIKANAFCSAQIDELLQP